MASIDYYDVLNRIQKIYHTFGKDEQVILRSILQEIYDKGESKTYEDLWLQDYKEIPVSIDEFLTNDLYLGKATSNGTSIYPHWNQVLRDIFRDETSYNEIIFTGATRIGKSSTAITAIAYMLYKLMCLRDPQRYFNKKEVSKFSILFFNLTKDLAKGVGFREFNDTLRTSPWFHDHGTFTNSDENFYYIPEGNKVVVAFGSSASHALGQQVYAGFCVVGDTVISTDKGNFKIEELEGQTVNVEQYDGKDFNYVPADIIKTKYVTDTIKITLEDGSTFEATPEHKIMLSDGTYKQLKDLTPDDDILSFNI